MGINRLVREELARNGLTDDLVYGLIGIYAV
jgi:hypothetical protein